LRTVNFGLDVTLIPWLKTELEIPIIAAGGISHGGQIAACLALGAAGVSVGTRFIASKEATVDIAYKNAVVSSTPEDIVMTTRVSGTPAAVINTEYVKKLGTDLPWLLKSLKDNPMTKKYVVPLIHLMGMKSLEKSANNPSWKTVWSAGQSVGLIDDILSTAEIYHRLLSEYQEAKSNLP
jgi:nitronate monooxygenase